MDAIKPLTLWWLVHCLSPQLDGPSVLSESTLLTADAPGPHGAPTALTATGRVPVVDLSVVHQVFLEITLWAPGRTALSVSLWWGHGIPSPTRSQPMRWEPLPRLEHLIANGHPRAQCRAIVEMAEVL